MSDTEDYEINFFERLSTAIVVQAVKDMRKYMTGNYTENIRNKHIEEVKNFFMSEWFFELTGLDNGDEIFDEVYRRLENECKQYDNKRIKS